MNNPFVLLPVWFVLRRNWKKRPSALSTSQRTSGTSATPTSWLCKRDWALRTERISRLTCETFTGPATSRITSSAFGTLYSKIRQTPSVWPEGISSGKRLDSFFVGIEVIELLKRYTVVWNSAQFAWDPRWHFYCLITACMYDEEDVAFIKNCCQVS